MEEDGEQTPRTPFWVQSTTNVHFIELYRRRIFFDSGVLIIFLPFLAIISMVFIIPTLISFTFYIFKPNSFIKSWEVINLILILFALAFGYLSNIIDNDNSKNNDELSSGLLTPGAEVSSQLTRNQSQRYDFPEQPIGLDGGEKGGNLEIKEVFLPPSPPPPPPPMVARGRTYIFVATRVPRPTTSTTTVPPFVKENPSVPVKMSIFNGIDDGSSSGESPMSCIPPPPPMPPFRIRDWKFPVEGDYVRVQSTSSSDDESQSP